MPISRPSPRIVRNALEDAPPQLTPTEQLNRLYREHSAAVFRVALRFGDRAFAEDICQDVFLRAFKVIEEVAAMENPGGWLYRVATNRCLSHLRAQRVRRSPLVTWIVRNKKTAPPDPESLGIQRDQLQKTFKHIHRLPPKMQACVWMYAVDGKNQTEIAEILGHNKSYVSKLLRRAREQLQEVDA